MSELRILVCVPQDLGARRRGQIVELVAYALRHEQIMGALESAGVTSLRVANAAPNDLPPEDLTVLPPAPDARE